MYRNLFDGPHLFILVLLLGLMVLWLGSLVDALRRPDAQWKAAGQNKILYVVLILLLGWLGALIYAAVPRRALKRVEANR
jgi:Phospholipase_D-nuclease N-terminal